MNQIKKFTKDLLLHYSTFSDNDGVFRLDLHDLPDFVQNEFASLLMSDDNAYAAEATGPDNKHWNTKMLPALTRYLQYSTNKDEEIEFNHVWRDCVTSYFHTKMQDLIDDYLQKYNSDGGYTVKDWNQYFGVTHLFGA